MRSKDKKIREIKISLNQSSLKSLLLQVCDETKLNLVQQTGGVSPAYWCPPASQKITRNKGRSIGLDFLSSVGREEKTQVSLSNTLHIFFHQTHCPNRSIKTKYQVLQAQFKTSLLWLCPKVLTGTSSWPSHTEQSSTTNYSSFTKPLTYIYKESFNREIYWYIKI